MAGFDTVTLLTDYGTADEFVGVIKSVIWSIAPQVRIVDLCHDITPFDVRGAGLMLARSAQYLCPGVVMAVVDPGIAGYLTVYPNDGLARPLASSLNYKAGDIIGNEIIARQMVDDVAPYTTPSFRVYSYAAAHIVIDVSGYFTPPSAEPLQCVEANSAQVTLAPNATARAIAPACPAGYTGTGGGCVSSSYPSINGLYFSNFGPTADSAYVCDGNNAGTSTVTFIARGTCCRVPGV